MSKGELMSGSNTWATIRRWIFIALGVVSLLWQSLTLALYMLGWLGWWNMGPSVSVVIGLHIAYSLFNLITGSVLLGLGLRIWLGWTLIYQVLLSILSAMAAITRADVWLASDNDHLSSWEMHPLWIGYGFYGFGALCGILLIIVILPRKSADITAP